MVRKLIESRRPWDDTALVTGVAKFIPYLSILLGFLITLSGRLLQTSSNRASYAFMAVGLVVALLGQLARSKADARVRLLRATQEQVRRRSPPALDASLATSASDGQLVVVLDAKSLTPFRATWTIVTEKDIVVSGIMLQPREIHPTPENRRFTAKANVERALVTNQYLKLQVSYESLYSAELGDPAELGGHISKSFRIDAGGVRPWTA